MKQELIENNYIYVPNFISKDETVVLAQEIYKRSKSSKLEGDIQVPVAECIHNFLPFIRLQVDKISQVSEICGEKVLPTYTYARIYKRGAILDRHRDRPACEISLSLNINKDVDWPIWFEKPNGEFVSLELNPGDAVLYLGCFGWHWRERYFGNNYTQLFIHYVKSFGTRAWAFYDIARSQDPTPKSADIPVTWL